MKPSTLFSSDTDQLKFLSGRAVQLYNEDSRVFEQELLQSLPTINPKVLRLILGELSAKGVHPLTEADPHQATEVLENVENVPTETVFLMLKYGFPSYVLLSSALDKAWGYDLRWLGKILDAADYLELDLSSGLLHQAVRSGSLPAVQMLLSRGSDPNRNVEGETPLRIVLEMFDRPEAEVNYPIYLQMIKELMKYKAVVGQEISEAVDRISTRSSDWSRKLQRAIQAGKRSVPSWEPIRETYWNLDRVEDSAMVALMHPERIVDRVMQEAVERERDKVVLVNDEVIGWPFYIDESKLKRCSYPLSELDPVPDAASPPSSEIVNAIALQGVPEFIPDTRPVLPSPPQTYYREPPTPVLATVPTFPLA